MDQVMDQVMGEASGVEAVGVESGSSRCEEGLELRAVLLSILVSITITI